MRAGPSITVQQRQVKAQGKARPEGNRAAPATQPRCGVVRWERNEPNRNLAAPTESTAM